MFVDRVKIHVKAGKGGDGIVAFRHEKYVAFGGPSGGDGGKGGDVIFEVDSGRTTLLDLRYHKKVLAEEGGNGKTKKMHGAGGDDWIVKVPLGTIVKRESDGSVIADLVKPFQQAVIASGGRGGRGNYRFKSSKNTAPQYSELGEPGEAFDILVELKVLSDVGLVGFPSVGKSTLLSVVSKAKPEIADYHFTTITPNLGVVQVQDGRSFIMADLPGLIEGAALGKGLGHQFLRHIERCRVILHVVDMGSEENRDPIADYDIINEELASYAYRLMERPQIVVANKMDLDNAQTNLAKFKAAYPEIEVFEATTMIGEGMDPILYRVADLLETTPIFPLLDVEKKEEIHGVLYTYTSDDPVYEINNLGNGKWEIVGDDIERIFARSKLDNDEDIMRFSRKMRTLGLDDALRVKGVQDGDEVVISKLKFEFIE